MEYRVVDVFAERALEGNPLTVVLDAGHLNDAEMQAIARETNHSETTFVTGPEKDGAWPVRIFTPTTELPFAGHPTLGTAFVLDASALALKVGRIPVAREGDGLWMTQNPAAFGPVLDKAMVSAALGVDVLATEVVSTGTPMGLVQVADSADVRRAVLDPSKYTGPDVAGVYVFALDGDHDIHARFFGHWVGIQEDPATGSAAGPLAAWLRREGVLPGRRTIHQGIELGRPSRIYIEHGDAPVVGGKVQDIARGRFTF